MDTGEPAMDVLQDKVCAVTGATRGLGEALPAGVDVVMLDEVQWAPFEIPGGNVAVEVAVLWAERDGPRMLAVRFPAGWERPDAWWYEAAEEFVVVSGSITLDGHEVATGGCVRIGAGVTRVATASPAGCVAIVRFDGPPIAHPGLGPVKEDS